MQKQHNSSSSSTRHPHSPGQPVPRLSARAGFAIEVHNYDNCAANCGCLLAYEWAGQRNIFDCDSSGQENKPFQHSLLQKQPSSQNVDFSCR